jgi:hypothetical protein
MSNKNVNVKTARVIPAQAGIQKASYVLWTLDSRLRGNDTF